MANLLIQTAFVGDLVLSLPLMRKMREAEPEAPLWLLGRKGLGGLFHELGFVDEVVDYDKTRPATWSEVRARMKGMRFGRIVSPHESPRTAWLVARLHAREKVGFAQWWNVFAYTHRLPRPMHLPDALRQVALLTAVDEEFSRTFNDWVTATGCQNPGERTDVWLSRSVTSIPNWASLSVLDRLGGSRQASRRVFLAPGSVWATKRWTAQGFVGVGRKLQADGFAVALVGSPEERELCDFIAAQLPGSENLAGRTSLLGTVREFLDGQCLITNDSGAMHLAAMAELPSVSVFGPTVLSFGYRPWQDRAVVVQQDLACRPCGKHGAAKCPLSTHECMKSIGPERVYAGAKEFLIAAPNSRPSAAERLHEIKANGQ